jgi:succinoglycan biosynthesis transport protein ExoP
MSEQFRASEDVEVDLRAVFGAVGRRLPLLILIALIVGAGVFAALQFVEPKYRAETTILIDTGETDLTGQADQTLTTTLLDAQGIASQVQLIQSRDVVLAVIDQLNLTEVPEFDPTQAQPSIIDRVLGWVGLGASQSDQPAEEVVLAKFRQRLDVHAIQNTRVISISFVSADPQLAADVANAVAQQYINRQRQVQLETTTDATEWLQNEIAALSDRVVEAEAAVETFRAEHDLFVTGQTAAGTNEVTLVTQSLTDLSAELSRVQTARAEAEAKADLIRTNLDNGSPLSSLDVLNSAVIQNLREQEAQIQSDLAEATATYLPGHPRIQALNAQLNDVEDAIRAEAMNILAGLENEATLERNYEAELNDQLNQLKDAAATSNQDEVQLRALERIAESDRQLLETYQALARDAVSRQSADFIPVNARIISLAAAPIEAYFPKPFSMAAIAAIITLMLAAAIALVRELASGRATRRVERPEAPQVPGQVPVDGRVRWDDDSEVRRMMPHAPGDKSALAAQIEQSLTGIAGKLRQKKARRVLITMADGAGDDGRPLAAVALARTLARTGARTLLVDLHADDADRIAMGETESLPGFGDLFAGEASFAQVIFRDRNSPAHYIPRGRQVAFADHDRLAELTEALDQTYDHVLYDISDPLVSLLGPSADAAVLLTEVEPSDPRTVKAYEAIKGLSSAEILLLVTAPLPAESVEGAAA